MERPKTLIQPNFKVNPLKRFVVYRGTALKVGRTNSINTYSEVYFDLIEAALSSSIPQAKKNGINDFIKNAQKNGYWDQIVGIYLPIWGNSVANKYNLKNPLSKELSFIGLPGDRVTHASGYIQGGAGGAYVDSGINPSSDGLSSSSGLLACNSLTNSSADVTDMGAYKSATLQMHIQARNSSNIFRSAMSSNVSGGFGTTFAAEGAVTSSLGLFTSNRVSSTSLSIYQDGSLVDSQSYSEWFVINKNIYFLAANSAGDADNSSRKYNFFCIGKGITNISDFNSDVMSMLLQV